jgi:uncharacterized membrane protein YbhN (UPF0104 family)
VNSRRLAFWSGTALGIAVIAFLLSRYDLEAVFVPLLHSKLYLLAAVMGLQAVIQVLNAMTPVILLGPPQDRGLSFWPQTRVFLAMQPLALFAPARLSDFGALPLLKQHHRPGAVASSIVVDRLITLFFLLLMTPIALRLAWPTHSSTAKDLAVVAALVAVALLPFILTNKTIRNLVNRFVLRPWPALLQGFGAHTDLLLRTSKARLSLNLAVTALKTLLAGTAISLLAMNVGVSIDMVMAISMSVLIQLATSLPIAPQGIGVAEGSLVLLFVINGLPGELALSMGVTARVLFIPVIALIYLGTTVPLIVERIADGG